MQLVLGVDSSTQSTKVEARDLDSGSVVATGRASHPATEPPVSEQDPGSWWEALVDAVAQIGEARGDVVAMAVGGQQHGLVLLDEAGAPLRPAKLWNDTTSAPQAEALVAELGGDTWARSCGSVPVASFTVSKLAWVAAHEPGALERTAQVMLPHDYLVWRLTDRHVTDRGDASGTGWFDPVADEYRPELLAAAVDGDWIDRLPLVLAPAEEAGPISAAAAAALGLPSDVVVGPGTGDNMAAALGLGLGQGDFVVSLGTSGTVYAVSATGTVDATGAVAGFADAAGGFLPLVCTLNATRVTDVVADWLGSDPSGLADLALQADRGDSDPVLLPYFDGERTPNLPDATGVFSGLRTGTSREQLALAAHDGVLCGLLEGLDALGDAGVDVGGRLHLIGGGARSSAYRQRAADLHGDAILVPDSDETVATGAAVQAAMVKTGRSRDELSAAWRLGEGELVEPQTDGSGTRAAYAAARREVFG